MSSRSSFITGVESVLVRRLCFRSQTTLRTATVLRSTTTFVGDSRRGARRMTPATPLAESSPSFRREVYRKT
ncbi:hypothetical protein AUR64_01705 [Haloprofundus marisrubri]|uniref:Uncharacterized protein n=1 Tax=Haloprofundus marisrubri TaxID=1514971 RepID=A0A0W1R3Q6_9EURY|nr:hypothetical protein AUR64_01705 [Haloprofundus marisrubri]